MVIRLGNPPFPRLALELLLDPVPGLQVDDRRMKATCWRFSRDLMRIKRLSPTMPTRLKQMNASSGHSAGLDWDSFCAVSHPSRSCRGGIAVIAGRRSWLWRAVGDERDASICWCNAAGHVSALNLKLKLLKKRGYALELPVIAEPRSYATTPETNLSLRGCDR